MKVVNALLIVFALISFGSLIFSLPFEGTVLRITIAFYLGLILSIIYDDIRKWRKRRRLAKGQITIDGHSFEFQYRKIGTDPILIIHSSDELSGNGFYMDAFSKGVNTHQLDELWEQNSDGTDLSRPARLEIESRVFEIPVRYANKHIGSLATLTMYIGYKKCDKNLENDFSIFIRYIHVSFGNGKRRRKFAFRLKKRNIPNFNPFPQFNPV